MPRFSRVMASSSSDNKEQLDNLCLLPAVIDVLAEGLPYVGELAEGLPAVRKQAEGLLPIPADTATTLPWTVNIQDFIDLRWSFASL